MVLYWNRKNDWDDRERESSKYSNIAVQNHIWRVHQTKKKNSISTDAQSADSDDDDYAQSWPRAYSWQEKTVSSSSNRSILFSKYSCTIIAVCEKRPKHKFIPLNVIISVYSIRFVAGNCIVHGGDQAQFSFFDANWWLRCRCRWWTNRKRITNNNIIIIIIIWSAVWLFFSVCRLSILQRFTLSLSLPMYIYVSVCVCAYAKRVFAKISYPKTQNRWAARAKKKKYVTKICKDIIIVLMSSASFFLLLSSA